jgi:hypothetical protein
MTPEDSATRRLAVLISLWLVAQMFCFGPQSFRVNLGVPIRLDRLLLTLMIAAFAGSVWRHRASPARLQRGEWCLLLFCGLCTLSLILSGANADDSMGKNRYLNALFNITYYPFLAYFIARSMPYDRRWVTLLLGFLCGMGVYLSMTGMFEHFGIEALVWPPYIMDPSIGAHWGRVRGPFLQSVWMGRMLIAGMLATFVLLYQARGLAKMFLQLAVLMMIGATYFTYTRGPWVGLAAALFVLVVLKHPARSFILRISALALVIFLTGVAGKFSLSDGTLFSRRQDTVSSRGVNAAIALRMGLSHPFMGIGFGKIRTEWESHVTRAESITIDDFFDDNHITYLGLFAEVGAIALLLYGLAVLYMLRMTWRVLHSLGSEPSEERSVMVMILASAAMYFITGLFSDLKWNALANIIMFLLFGVARSLSRKLEAERDAQGKEEGATPEPAFQTPPEIRTLA